MKHFLYLPLFCLLFLPFNLFGFPPIPSKIQVVSSLSDNSCTFLDKVGQPAESQEPDITDWVKHYNTPNERSLRRYLASKSTYNFILTTFKQIAGEVKKEKYTHTIYPYLFKQLSSRPPREWHIEESIYALKEELRKENNQKELWEFFRLYKEHFEKFIEKHENKINFSEHEIQLDDSEGQMTIITALNTSIKNP